MSILEFKKEKLMSCYIYSTINVPEYINFVLFDYCLSNTTLVRVNSAYKHETVNLNVSIEEAMEYCEQKFKKQAEEIIRELSILLDKNPNQLSII